MRWVFWTMAFGAILGIAVFYSIPSHAAEIQKPSICVEFDSAPTFATVNAVMQSLIDNGHDINEAADLLVSTLDQHCPQHIPLIQAYVEAGVFLYPELKK